MIKEEKTGRKTDKLGITESSSFLVPFTNLFFDFISFFIFATLKGTTLSSFHTLSKPPIIYSLFSSSGNPLCTRSDVFCLVIFLFTFGRHADKFDLYIYILFV